VTVTHDTDYLALAASGVAHAGIAWSEETDYLSLASNPATISPRTGTQMPTLAPRRRASSTQ
jgi:hypothetical protein